MKLSLRHVVAVAAIASMPLLAHAGDLAKAAPSDAVFVSWVENASFTKSKWEGSRMSEIWNAPEMGKMRTFFDRKYNEMEKEFEAEMEFPLKDLIALVSGEAVVSVGSFVKPTEENGLSEPEPGSLILAMNLKDSDRGTVDKLLEKGKADLPPDTKSRSYDVNGVTVYSLEFVDEEEVYGEWDPSMGDSEPPMIKKQTPVTLQYAFPTGNFVFAYGNTEPIKGYLANLSGAGTNAVGNTDKFSRSMAEAGGQSLDLNFYFDYTQFVDGSMASAEEVEEMTKTIRALGLSDSGPLMVNAGIDKTSSSFTMVNLVPAQKAGIFSLIYGMPANSLSTFAQVPGEATQAATWTLSGSALMRDVKAMLLSISPEAYGGLNMGLAFANQSAGVNVETDIINNIEGEHLYYRLPLTSDDFASISNGSGVPAQLLLASKSVTRIGFANGPAMVATLDGVMERSMSNPEQPLPIDKTEIQGFANYRAKPEAGMPPGVTPSVTLTPSGLMVAFDDAILQDAVRRVAGKGTNSFAEQPAVASAIAGVDKSDLKIFSFVTEEANIETIRVQFESLKAMGSEGADADTTEFFAAIPDSFDFLKGKLGNTLGGMWTKPTAILVRSRQSSE